MTHLPSLFISHGAPDLPLREGPTRDFLRALPDELPAVPRAIVAVSAHWTTARPTVSTTAQPRTIFDFRGFDPQLLDLRYPAPGDPDLARDVADRLERSGFALRTNNRRGFDHGVWTPLLLLAPDATIPVVQLSVQPRESPARHRQLGRALAPLRADGVLILATGAATHNLRATSADYHAPPPAWAMAFDNWLAERIARDDRARLLDYAASAPEATRNHPTPEHLLPLFVALGAGGAGRQLHRNFTYGALSMAAYAFD